MFEILSEKLANIFRGLSGKGKVSENDVDEAMREVRLALLEADVNFKVVKDFTTTTIWTQRVHASVRSGMNLT